MSQDQGTRWESAVVKYGLERGVELRRAVQEGRLDVGDIHGLPDAILQAKDAKGHQLAAWVDAAKEQAVRAGVPWGIVTVKRRRGPKSSGSVASAYAIMDLETLLDIMVDLAEGREAIQRLEEADLPEPLEVPDEGRILYSDEPTEWEHGLWD